MRPTDADRRSRRLRVLAVVARFKSSHIDYLHALGARTDLTIAWSGEGGRPGVAETAAREGVPVTPIGRLGDVASGIVKRRLRAVIRETGPEIVHVLYYRHEALAVMVRDIVGTDARVVFECRDPLTTLERASPGSEPWQLEGAAIRASDGQILVSDALRRYLERQHDLDLSSSSIVVPHAFARRTAGPVRPKLSAGDGRTHLAIVGTAYPDPSHGRYYVDIIRRLVAQGVVVHSHFHRIDGVSLEPYERLAAQLPGWYEHDDKVPYREGTRLSDVISRYDLMGVFHQLGAAENDESATLAVCMPTKAVSAWLHGAIPIVCYPHYRGLVERIEAHGIGFVVERLEDVGRIAVDRAALERATAATIEVRDVFTHEYQVERIVAFYRRLATPSG